ncbi:GtrA family protein [Ectobacillus sp. sgz5001026]|uniref:GtrA family protein n=1 Tax=Ectobacillus sp. sgz5001026 TaxID=3242473 RepID=UPI0036D3B367
MGKFVFVNIITLVITSVMLVILHQYAGWSILISKCGVTALGLIVNFTGSRFWVFAEHTKERRGSIYCRRSGSVWN